MTNYKQKKPNEMMSTIHTFWIWAKPRLFQDKQLILTYCLVYFVWGMGMNWLGSQLAIAKFTFWWQVISCYILYMVPISLLLKGFSFFQQYAYGLVAMGFLEFAGYALETSYAYPNNLIDLWFNQRNFSLTMALFFALYFPLGNMLVAKIYDVFRVK